MRKPTKKKLNTADKYLIFSIFVLLMFSITVVIFDALKLQVQDQLILGMFGFFGTEIAACCVIKIMNVKYQDNHSNDDIYYDDYSNGNYDERYEDDYYDAQ